MLRRLSFLPALLSLGALVAACAVGGDDTLTGQPGRQVPDPPQGGSGGTFDPGNGGVPGSGASYGSGASSSVGAGSGGEAGEGGAGGSEPVKPPECTDDLKRCEREFTLPDSGETSVELRGDFAPGAWEKGVAMIKSGTVWKTTAQIPFNKPVTYKYYVNGTTWVPDPDPAIPQVDDGFGSKNSVLSPMTCAWWSCEAPPATGTFDWRDAVMYFAFVDRFYNGDKSNDKPLGIDPSVDYQGGDWKGLLQKVNEGYFSDLGINALWLTVPLDNPSVSGLGSDGRQYSAYHGYWPSNLEAYEEHFGTKEDFAALVDACHKQGIKVLVDYAMNHVHSSAPIYQQNKSWFWPNENGKGGNCVCGEGCGWDGSDGVRCWFRDYLPDFNFDIAEARKASVDNALWWIKETKVDGYRLDAIKHINEQWVKDLRNRVKAEIEPITGEYFYMVGETFTGDKGTIKKYVDPSMLDGQFDFPLRMEMASKLLLRQGSMSDLAGFLDGNDTYYGAGSIMSTFIGNHDIPRPIHLAQDNPLWGDPWADGKDKAFDNKPGLPGEKSAFERLANSFTMLFTMKGVPLVYYGDEIGMPGAGDPDNRRFMQWENVSGNQTFLKDHLKKLSKIRADHPALRRGTRTGVSSSGDVLVYRMSTTGDTVYVAINRADGERQATGLPASATDLLSGKTVTGPSANVPARGALVLVEK
jgi:glycosidase